MQVEPKQAEYGQPEFKPIEHQRTEHEPSEHEQPELRPTKQIKVVLVHDYLNQQGGAERVVGVLHALYPAAVIHTLFVDEATLWPTLRDATIVPSVLQRIPLIMAHFKLFFWLYPFVIKNIRIQDCDVVISSSSAYAKGVRVATGANGRRPKHICYCHTPMRFAWDYDHYIANETGSQLLAKAARVLVPLLRAWDVRSARTVDVFVANSTVVRDRIRKYYDRDATIIYPPVERRDLLQAVDRGDAEVATTEAHYLLVSRLVAYKRLDLAITACTQLQLPLLVIGQGPDRERLENLAGPTVRFAGFLPEAEVARQMAGCKALIFPGEEDFGITPLEANSLGRPVVAYRGGGALDTIVDGVSGVFFDEPSVQALAKALLQVDEIAWDPLQIRAAAARFNRSVFEARMTALVEQAVATPDTARASGAKVNGAKVSGATGNGVVEKGVSE